VTVFQFLSPRLVSRETINEISRFDLLLGFRWRLVSTFVTSTAPATAVLLGASARLLHERSDRISFMAMARAPDFINKLARAAESNRRARMQPVHADRSTRCVLTSENQLGEAQSG